MLGFFGLDGVVRVLRLQSSKLQGIIKDRQEDIAEIDGKIEDLLEEKQMCIVERDAAKKIFNDLKKYVKEEKDE